jgi:hypothetical protein
MYIIERTVHSSFKKLFYILKTLYIAYILCRYNAIVVVVHAETVGLAPESNPTIARYKASTVKKVQHYVQIAYQTITRTVKK